MTQVISVLYKLYNKEEYDSVPVLYQIEEQPGYKLLSCTIGTATDQHLPKWLKIRKFDITTVHVNGHYTILYDEKNHATNIDTSLFIDKAYQDIMRKENLALA